MEAALCVVEYDVCVHDWISTEFMNETVIPSQHFEPTIQLNIETEMPFVIWH